MDTHLIACFLRVCKGINMSLSCWGFFFQKLEQHHNFTVNCLNIQLFLVVPQFILLSTTMIMSLTLWTGLRKNCYLCHIRKCCYILLYSEQQSTPVCSQSILATCITAHRTPHPLPCLHSITYVRVIAVLLNVHTDYGSTVCGLVIIT